jgi:GLPGLI family protein
MTTKQIFVTILLGAMAHGAQAQQFISKGKIEFEVKNNLKKTLGAADNMFTQMMPEMPNFKTAYYSYTFANNRSYYKLDRFSEGEKLPDFFKKEDEENEWFCDFDKGELKMKKTVIGTPFYINDSLRNIKWRYTNESRVIAGFNCRKAIGRIYDSVYVFAFYTDEITITGGPCSINGLPGMIMGLTIPRLYTSWIATKLTLSGVDESKIVAEAAKKPTTLNEVKDLLLVRSKDWTMGDNSESTKNWITQYIWSATL